MYIIITSIPYVYIRLYTFDFHISIELQVQTGSFLSYSRLAQKCINGGRTWTNHQDL
jgi:hypothetical protein